MERIPVNKDNTNEAFEHVFKNGMNNPIIATTEPTSESLKVNVVTFYGGYMYIKFQNGDSYKFLGTAI